MLVDGMPDGTSWQDLKDFIRKKTGERRMMMMVTLTAMVTLMSMAATHATPRHVTPRRGFSLPSPWRGVAWRVLVG